MKSAAGRPFGVRGAWRPFVSATPLALALAAAALFAGRGRPGAEGALVIGVSCVLVWPTFFLAQTQHLARAFLRGLEDGGQAARIERDEVGWLGDRRIDAVAGSGTWRLRAHPGRYARLDVQAPGARSTQRVWRRARLAGREAAEAARTGSAWRPPRPFPALVPPRGRAPRIPAAQRARLALALAAGSFAASLLVALVASPRDFAVLVGLVAAAGWFVTLVAAGSEAAARGLRGWLLVGSAAGTAFVGATYAGGLALRHANAEAPLAALALAAAALAAGWAARGSRAALALGALPLGAAALGLPGFYRLLTLGLAAACLLTAAPPARSKRPRAE